MIDLKKKPYITKQRLRKRVTINSTKFKKENNGLTNATLKELQMYLGTNIEKLKFTSNEYFIVKYQDNSIGKMAWKCLTGLYLNVTIYNSNIEAFYVLFENKGKFELYNIKRKQIQKKMYQLYKENVLKIS